MSCWEKSAENYRLRVLVFFVVLCILSVVLEFIFPIGFEGGACHGGYSSGVRHHFVDRTIVFE
jgi:hypothetical protein